jgi:hypothetical protein
VTCFTEKILYFKLKPSQSCTGALDLHRATGRNSKLERGRSPTPTVRAPQVILVGIHRLQPCDSWYLRSPVHLRRSIPWQRLHVGRLVSTQSRPLGLHRAAFQFAHLAVWREVIYDGPNLCWIIQKGDSQSITPPQQSPVILGLSPSGCSSALPSAALEG